MCTSTDRDVNRTDQVQTSVDLQNEVVATVASLRGYAYRLTSNKDRAEDLLQDTALRALSYLHQFTPGTSMKAWIFTIMRRHYYAQYRNEINHRRTLSQLDLRWSSQPSPEDCEIKMVLDSWQGKSGGVSNSDFVRKVFILTHVFGYEYQEISDKSGVNIGTIKSRMYRAREMLVKAMTLQE